MQLKELLPRAEGLLANIDIKGMTCDSRKVGQIFVTVYLHRGKVSVML